MLRTLTDHGGINWTHYYVVELRDDMTCEIQETFRLHKYDTPDHDDVIVNRMGYPKPIKASFYRQKVEVQEPFDGGILTNIYTVVMRENAF